VLRSWFIFLFFVPVLNAQEIKNVKLLDHWHEDTLITNSNLVRYSGCWGFERNGREYAIIGSTEGNHFFLLTDNDQLQHAGFVEGKFNSSQVVHREFKTYQNYAYAICDEGTSSMQIIDLSYLPDSVVKVADIQNVNFGKVHNLFIDTAHALLYACKVTPIIGGIPQSPVPLRVFSLADPINPLLLWEGPPDIPEVHDCYVRDNIAILNCGENGLRVYDFSNPVVPFYLNNLQFYQDQGYNHQGWLSPDGKTYVFADETSGKRVKKCSVETDLSIQITGLFGTNYEENSIPHNIMCTNELAFVAYYNEGLRIFDLKHGNTEVGAYDTYTDESVFKMNGAWGVFSNYTSERIIISDRQNGLFLFDFDRSVFAEGSTAQFSCNPNPVELGGSVMLRSPKDEITEFSVEVFNAVGEKLKRIDIKDQTYFELGGLNTSGVYFLRITYVNYLDDVTTESIKLIVQ
jgi:choice-of-anchor B domain-containing protein